MSKEKDLGQFFTDERIARFMTRWVTKGSCETILDPAVGPGIFMKMAREISPKTKRIAFEVDPDMVQTFRAHAKFAVQLYEEDYLYADLEKPASAIVCNPPYNKFQKIPNRENLRKIFKEKYGISLSGYSNYCVYFLIKSMQELREKGRLAYIIPYEFLNTGYGKVVKEYFLKCRYLKTIIKFDNDLKLFEDAITTSCILLMEKKEHEEVEFVSMLSLEELNKWDKQKEEVHAYSKIYRYQDLNPEEKWLTYFKSSKGFEGCEEFREENLVPFSTYGTVKRGIATGNNAYFTLNRDKIQKLGLSESVCIPCITKAPDIKTVIFDRQEMEKLRTENKKIYLFDGKKAVSKEDAEYIKLGEENDVPKGYLNSHRNPWYALEEKEAAPILISVFSRENIKVVRNEVMVKNLTTFHGIYFGKKIPEEEINLFFCYLLTPVAQELLRKNKREYGEGLDKFEPGDLNKGKVLNLNLLSVQDKKKVADIYSKLKQKDAKTLIKKLNQIFLPYCKKGTV